MRFKTRCSLRVLRLKGEYWSRMIFGRIAMAPPHPTARKGNPPRLGKGISTHALQPGRARLRAPLSPACSLSDPT